MRSLVLVAALLGCAQAAAQPKEIYVHGEGTRSCREYLQHRSEGSPNQDYFYVTWVRGFLAGYNVATSFNPTEPRIPDSRDLLASLDAYCADNPRKRVVDATIALAGQLGGRHRR